MKYRPKYRFIAWSLVMLLMSPFTTLGDQADDRTLARENLGQIFAAQLGESGKAEKLVELGLQEEDVTEATSRAGYLLADCFIDLFENFTGSERDYLLNISIMMSNASSFFSRLETLSSLYGDGSGELDHQVLLTALDTFQHCGSASMEAAGFPVEVLNTEGESCTADE